MSGESTRERARTEERLRRHVEVLAGEIGPRVLGAGDALSRAEAYLRDELEAAGLRVERRAYRFFGREVANLVGVPPASREARRWYLVGAHYDTVADTPGADDNASAVAVMLELARRLARASLPLRFVAFTLEEPPAFATPWQGSRRFCRDTRRRGEEVLGAIVLEMVGFTAAHQPYPAVLARRGYPETGDFIGVIGDRRSRAFTQRLVAGMKAAGTVPVESLIVGLRGWLLPISRLSDHASFWDRGWPAVMVTDTAFLRNPNYHRPSDTPETLDYRFMAGVAEALEVAIRGLPAA
ncbi:MAG: M28 family peptidase [Geminicoccaceae bacterium]|nr:M28 family peptidase [Geminicoccaceae bacterium]MCS7268612.1 M28 family peptidase [Geminicoccaceae bacterium]MCX7631163.1 M28 family peptidase [Geminicoccaceae bacterium]MDW8125341.1 M28 family peptidase [Geminicoccaceae bacterium]MDW8342618.1 M28 family peptidase [Geminicoccaceae bacterium]